MLLRLRHDAFIRGDHQQHQIHTYYSGNHIVDESLMPRYINNSHTVSARKVKISESQVNSDPPSLLFLPAVRIPSRQRLDQRRLPVIDMACRTNNYILHILPQSSSFN